MTKSTMTNENPRDKENEPSEAVTKTTTEILTKHLTAVGTKKSINGSSVNNNNSARSSCTSNAVIEEQRATTNSTNFGWGKFKPKCLQKFCTAKWALFWLCWGGALQGLVVNGFINVVITTIERRFGLRSRQTGLVASGYDIASFLCLLPVTYFGGRLGASKPRWIAWGSILMGLGSITFALPHFMVGTYRATMTDVNVCAVMELNSNMTQNCDNPSNESEEMENYTWTVWIFLIAQLLHGAGAAPLFTLGVTFIDENVSKKMSSVYLGIYYTMAIIGPAVGFVVGGQFLLIHTDFMDIDAASMGLTSESNTWIGAWWIGFIFAALACILLAIPIIAYPKSLPGSEDLKQEKITEAYNATADEKTSENCTKLKELPKALLALLKNPTLFFLNLAGASEGMLIAGFAAFLPKQLENQFSISPVWAALLVGLITVPAGGGGTFVGGYLVKKFNLTCAGIIKLCLTTTAIAVVFSLCFLLSCPNMGFAGVTTGYAAGNGKPRVYNGWLDTKELSVTLDATCNSGCHCDRLNYEPICGIDNIMYYSPCHAGCQTEVTLGSTKIYRNCSCIVGEGENLEPLEYEATNTMCESSCRHMPFFAAICGVLMVFTFMTTMPALSATLRCVHDDQRSFALGIQWIKVRLLGTIPAPMIFGALIDETCLLWHESCDKQEGACLVYDNHYMSKYMWILASLAKCVSVIFFFGAWWFYIPPKHVDNSSEDVDEEGAVAANADNSTTATTVDSMVVDIVQTPSTQTSSGITSSSAASVSSATSSASTTATTEQQLCVVTPPPTPATEAATSVIDKNTMNEIGDGHAQSKTAVDSGGRY